MKISPITKDQWISVVKNALIAGVTAFLATVQVVGVNKSGAVAGLSAALAAIVKIVEKALTTV